MSPPCNRETLLKMYLIDTVLAPGRVSDRQFGFMSSKSTEDAVVELRRAVSVSEGKYSIVLLFDISGAFDWWPLVLQELNSRECPKNVFEVLRSYFDKRRVSISIGDTKVSKWATRR